MQEVAWANVHLARNCNTMPTFAFLQWLGSPPWPLYETNSTAEIYWEGLPIPPRLLSLPTTRMHVVHLHARQANVATYTQTNGAIGICAICTVCVPIACRIECRWCHEARQSNQRLGGPPSQVHPSIVQPVRHTPLSTSKFLLYCKGDSRLHP
jgi:hypothetical protein